MSPDDFVLYGVVAMPAIAAVVEIFKGAGLPTRFAGVTALTLGVVAGVLAGLSDDLSLGFTTAQGLMAGLGASGIWSLTVGSSAAKPPPTRRRR